MKIFNFLKDIFAPKYCYICKKESYFLCQKCMSKMSDFESICYVCKGKTQNYNVHDKCRTGVYYDKIIILTHYREKNVARLIKDAKFYGKKEIFYDFSFYSVKKILQTLGREYNFFSSEKDYFIILPTPMSFFRKLKRGYNQAEIFVRYITDILELPFSNKILKKIRHTGQQSKLNRQERTLNLKNSFQINKKQRDKIDKKIVILVDDVVSTGTTLNEISKILKENGAEKVFCFCIASD